MKHLSVKLVAVVLAASFLTAPALQAKTLRWSSQGDILTMDPHAQNEGLNNTSSSYVYEPLVTYNDKFQLEPALATSWSKEGPLIWKFNLRTGVKFHDGTPFTAEDVVFSITRAMEPTSNFKIYATGIQGAKAVGTNTVLIYTSSPTPILLRQLTELRIMSKAWAEKNKVVKPQDYINKEETFAVRNANGTGPYMLKSREIDVKTVFAESPNWWGKSTKRGNVTEVVYTPIKQAATRTAALLSGEIDFVLDPAPQDIERLSKAGNTKVIEGAENRTIFLGFDQNRDELLYSSVKGKNPFKDVRVRQALYHAIDIEAIKRAVMRGSAEPTGTMISPQVNGWSKAVDTRLPHDEARAKQLLADAGYPQGFEFVLDCPNNRYINDEAVCQAIVGMWAKIGLKVRLNAMPRATYFAKIQKFDTSAYLLGWGVPTFDALYSIQSLIRSVGQGGDGNFNLGRFSNKQIDDIVDKVKVEIDESKRNAMITDVLKQHAAEVGHIPLHNQVIPWAMRKNVNVVHRADNRLEMRWVKID
jgi:peptide/nickel transport system substrate-binding protein